MFFRALLATAVVSAVVVPLAGQTYNRRDFVKLGTQALKDNDLPLALKLGENCLRQFPLESKCAKIRDDAKLRIATGWKVHAERLPALNLPEIVRAWEQVATVDKSDLAMQQLAQARANLQRVRDNGATFLGALHDGTVPSDIPSTLQPYVLYVAELADLPTELKVHQALQRSQLAEREQRLSDALAALEPFKAHVEVAPRVRELSERQVGATTGEVQRLLQSNGPDDLWLALSQLHAGDGQSLPAPLRNELSAEGDRLATLRLAPFFEKVGNSDARQAVARLVETRIPGKAASAIRWEKLNTLGPGLSVSITASSPDPSRCPGITNASLSEAIQQSLPFQAITTADARVAVALEGVDCLVETEQGSEEAVNSTYAASQQQVANAAYVQLQARLQQAQQELAALRQKHVLNPASNGWEGAAQGLAEGLAINRVNSLSNQLAATAPFLSEPVVLAYTPYRYSVAKTARVKATFSVTDGATGFADALTVQGGAQAQGQGLRGVLAGDRSGMSNKQPSFKSDGELLQEALNGAIGDTKAPLQRSLAQVAVLRADAELRSKASIPTVAGYVLLAKDFGAGPETLSKYAALLTEIEQTPLAKLSTLKRPAVTPSKLPAGRATAAVVPAPKATRTKMIDATLDSVVTVSTEGGSGSGFFVGQAGHVITNAHVVEGAARIIIKTRSKESVLAKIVKLSLADDLALLSTTGLTVNGLPLGLSEEAEVGADVVAVGSPHGLEGTVTRGIISGLRNIAAVPYLQIDAAINPGNSGGPLLNETGRVIGVNTWKLSMKSTDSIGFAIAIDHVKKLFGALLPVAR